MNKTLKYSLLAGSVYFFCISLFHFLGIKIPGLFIYYNIPSHHYQDQIISFLAFGWSAFFYSAYKNISIVPFVLLSCFMALLGLANINSSTNFESLVKGADATPFWIQTVLLSIYVAWLVIFYITSINKKNTL